MLKRTLCEAAITWKLECKGPLLIRDGRYKKPKTDLKTEHFPDCLFISHLTETELTKTVAHCQNKPPILPYYVPGTSIRGPFRAHAERIIRSLLPEVSSHITACDPFSDEEKNGMPRGCSRHLEDTAGTPYAEICPACKIFGCCGQASRIQIVDAEITTCSSVYRDMIGIDRFTGAVSKGDRSGKSKGANMCFHVLEQSKFETSIRLVNFELWHLGLLAYVFRDFEEGRVPIGFGKTKGFGQVKGEVSDIVLAYPQKPEKLEHMGSLMKDDELKRYDILDTASGEYSEFEPADKGLALFPRFRVKDKDAFWQEVAPRFNSYLEALQAREKGTAS